MERGKKVSNATAAGNGSTSGILTFPQGPTQAKRMSPISVLVAGKNRRTEIQTVGQSNVFV